MKRIYPLFVYIVSALLCFVASAQQNFSFEQNKGQWNDEILFRSHRKGGAVYLKQNVISILVKDTGNSYLHPHNNQNSETKERFSVFSIKPINSLHAEIEAKDRLSYYTNYFTGNDKSKHFSKVPTFSYVIYKNIYKGIDWQINSSPNGFKHTFIVHAGSDPEDIVLEYGGVENLEVKEGKLFIKTKYGELTEDAPYIIQRKDGKIQKIKGEYLIDGNLLRYSVEEYDRNIDLEIDPDLKFSTYIGSQSDSWGMTSCYDSRGRMISGGITYGDDYPTTDGAYDISYSNHWDCVITKYNEDASQLLFSTFLGGSLGEMPHSMTVNRLGEIVILGTTGSSDFPVNDNAFQTNFHGGENLIYENSIMFTQGADIFIACLSPAGDSLISSTFLGGSGNDGLNFRPEYSSNAVVLTNGNDSLYYNYGDIARGEIITDEQNNVYIASCTFSTDFPTSFGAFQSINKGKQESVAAKLDRSLSQLIYSTYIGGQGDDAAYSIDLDSLNRLYITGGTVSEDFPTTTGSYNTTFNGGTADAFICRISSDGTILEHSSFFGSPEYDQAFFVRLDTEGYPYILGQTKAEGYDLINNATYSIPNSGQFVAKFFPELDSLAWSTVFGSGDGMVNISPSGFTIDLCKRIYCAGWGRIFKYNKNMLNFSSLGTENLQTTSNAYSQTTDGQDFYILALEPDAAGLNYATFFGEINNASTYTGIDHVDGGTSRFDRYGNLYQSICASCGGSQLMPTTENAWSSENLSSNCNIAAVKFEINNDFAVADFSVEKSACTGTQISFNNLSRADNFLWDFGDGTTSTSENPIHSYNQAGLYSVSLKVSLSSACHEQDSIKKNILIIGDTSYFLDTIMTCSSVPVQIGLDYYSEEDDITTYLWQPAELVSNPFAANPYFIGTNPETLQLTITNGQCRDTLYQHINTTRLSTSLIDTLEFCSLPYYYKTELTEDVETDISFFNDFRQSENLLNDSSILISDTSKRFLYFSFTKGNCRNIDSIYLKYTGYDFDLNITNTGCSSENNGKAEVISHSFPTQVHYQWSASDIDNAKVENLAMGSYYVKVSDENGCSLQKTFSVGAYDDLNVSAEKQNNSCEDVNNGKIHISISGGNAPYSVQWSNGETDTLIENLPPGIYNYIVKDNSECSVSGDIEIKSQDTIHILLEKTFNNCYEGCSARITGNVYGGSEPYSFVWSNGATSQNISDLCNGLYSVILTDNNGCKATAQEEITNINVFENFQVWASDYTIYDGSSTYLHSTFLDGFSYLWTPSSPLSNPNSATTLATLNESTDFNLSVTDNKGCIVNKELHIEVEFVNCGEPNIFIANAFTPNGDGINDEISVSGNYISSINLTIYDRWGEKVFQTKDLDGHWDGNYRGKECAAGVYFYKLEVSCLGGKTFVKGGDITLIR
ncbi:MAG: gliding motility-associated C-terminal domain-containing protein [Bacteroidales bacterium]|nr:gliding motility-associated C-terminal domain-containing protein [Bacteroidales bacterium]